uniref:Tol-Pal system protein TolB n=1 Tax=Candidatus Methanogaster sp. ANME-2c ERB4 TaxID=2759911 RepID=A0A7G9YDX5_9EURY|nr:Tol-Pal system protein TolB [Methanosarcinales archaeon ANME-2c ERB4]
MRRKFILIGIAAMMAMVAGAGYVSAAITVEDLTQLTTDSANEYNPAWSPTGDEIVFGRNADIYKVSSDGLHETQLTSNPNCEQRYKWSSDNTKIVYDKDNTNGWNDVWIMNTDGSLQTDLTNNPQSVYGVWSPDGTKIAYVHGSNYNQPLDLIIMNPDGSNKQIIATGQPSYGTCIAWSPDASKIAFSSGATGSRGIRVINADGTSLTPIASGDIMTQTQSWQTQVWSADGTKIVYHSDEDRNWDIYTINADGTGKTQLTTDPSDDRSAYFSPDGSKILFVSDRSGNSDIWVMDVDGSNKVQLTTNTSVDTGPTWSPDGSKIAFQSDRSGNYDIWVIDVSDGRMTEIAYDDGEKDGAWSFGSDSGWGHGVLFNVGAPTTITKVKIYGRIYDANPSFIPPGFGETFDVEIRDSSLNKLDSVTYDYDDYFTESYGWAVIDIPDASVDDDFYIWVNTKSFQSTDIGKGILIGEDSNSPTGNSFKIETTTDSILETWDSNWMIRALVHGAGGENHAPEITSITPEPPVVCPGGSSTITVVASDQDGDELSYSYDCSDGGKISGSGSVVTWTAPSVVGTCRVDVTVSDGEESVSDSVDITVSEEEKPDLAVTKINYSPENPEVGDDVTVNSAVIENIGKEDATSPFDVALYINHEWKTSITVEDGILSGDSKTINFDYQWQIEGKPYTIKVVADDGGVIEEDFVVNNMKWVSFKPRPWLKITTDKSTYKGDGEKVNINIEFYTQNNNDLLLIKETCDGHVEYCSVIVLSSLTSPITIPALPVYNNKKHIVSGSLLTSAGSQLTTDKAEYIVEPTDDVDMIILTNPEKLQKQFNKADWIQILYDIQLATDDGGILVYTDGSTYSDISWDIHVADWVLETIDYLFILGGDDVIPYRKIDFNCKESVTDKYYWDFKDYGHTPVIRYARLPTTKSSGSEYRDLDRYLNKKVFDRILLNEPSYPKNIDKALIFSGRDAKTIVKDIQFKDRSEYIKGKLQNDKYVSIKEYRLNSDGTTENTYDFTYLKLADLICFVGHGDTNSVAMLGLHNSVEIHRYNLPSEEIRFYNNPFEHTDFTVSIQEGHSDRLSLPVVFASSCLTANHAKDTDDVPLSEVFMHFNAGSYAGYGCSVNGIANDKVTTAYFNEIVVEQDLGSIFYNSMRAASNEIEGSIFVNIENLDYFIQFGYPKWNIDPDEPAPDYSNPLLADNIEFEILDYNITTFYGNTTINFTGRLNGEPVNSTDWMLPGNPVVPYLHLVYDLPEGKTVNQIAYTATDRLVLGQYDVLWIPGYYSGDLYEHYPLNLTIYMEQPVKWKIFEKTDGNMCAVIDIFPFQYYPDNDTVIFYNNFTISTSERDRTASIDGISTDKRMYVKGDIAEITVNCTGSALINMTVDGSGSMTQQSTGSDVFTVDTSMLTAGSHDVDFKLYDGNSLLDETLTSISVVDSLINMSLETSVNSTAVGSSLNLSILVTNLGGSATIVSPDLVIETENVSRINLSDLTLSGHKSKFINTTIDTDDMPSGLAIIYAEAELGMITVNSNYETVTMYEDLSDIVIDYKIEPEVIHLTFSSPYVDNVHYSLDNGVNAPLYEPYDIDISHLTEGSTHNITIYADDVFGNENSTSFQFVRSTVHKGDLNSDGILTPADAVIALQLAASGGWDPVADMSDDNRITSLDALMILQSAAETQT